MIYTNFSSFRKELEGLYTNFDKVLLKIVS